MTVLLCANHCTIYSCLLGVDVCSRCGVVLTDSQDLVGVTASTTHYDTSVVATSAASERKCVRIRTQVHTQLIKRILAIPLLKILAAHH